MKRVDSEKLGPPDLKFAGLSLWIICRQYEDETDYWDGNWLNVVAHSGSFGSDVWASGAFLHLSDLAEWRSELSRLHEQINGIAELPSIEPNLSAKVVLARISQMTLAILW